MYNSCVSKLLEFRILSESFSRQVESFGGLYITPKRIGLVVGRRISIKIFSISLEKSLRWL